MRAVDQRICADLGQPIVFRTTNREVREATLHTGSLWLRSAKYYQQLEDNARNDRSEGVSAGRMTIPLRVGFNNEDNMMNISGPGHIGQAIVPHYILSMHGHSISSAQLQSFGGFTFGIKNLLQANDEGARVYGVSVWCHLLPIYSSLPSSAGDWLGRNSTEQ